MDWYKKDIPAYRRATRTLTPRENGIYDRLLNEYYATESPLPDDPNYLKNVCGCGHKRDMDALKLVLDTFFPRNGDGLRHNTRADDEIAEYKEKCDSARSAARASVAKRSLNAASASRSTDREIDRKKEGKPVDNSTCQHVNPNGQKCGQPGTHKLHPQSKDWYCSDHRDG